MKIGVVEEPVWGLYRKKTINYRGQALAVDAVDAVDAVSGY